jgi:hypothetical protein
MLANTKKGDVILSRLEKKHSFQRHAGAETYYQWRIEYSIDHFSLLFILERASDVLNIFNTIFFII